LKSNVPIVSSRKTKVSSTMKLVSFLTFFFVMKAYGITSEDNKDEDRFIKYAVSLSDSIISKEFSFI
jgi:hypothetical protein